MIAPSSSLLNYRTEQRDSGSLVVWKSEVSIFYCRCLWENPVLRLSATLQIVCLNIKGLSTCSTPEFWYWISDTAYKNTYLILQSVIPSQDRPCLYLCLCCLLHVPHHHVLKCSTASEWIMSLSRRREGRRRKKRIPYRKTFLAWPSFWKIQTAPSIQA